MPRKSCLTRVAVCRLGPGGIYRNQLAMIPTEQILYCFTAGAITSKRMVISASWGQDRAFRPGTVYLRSEQGLFATRYRTLRELIRHLDPNDFGSVHQSVVVNIQRIIAIDLGARFKMLRVGSNGATEALIISRRYIRSLRRELGI